MVVVVRPLMKDPADPTHVTYEWGGIILDYAYKMGMQVLDVAGEWVEYQKLTYLLKQYPPDLFVYTGHGCKNYLATQNGCSLTNGWLEDVCEKQCNMPSNLGVLKGSIVVTFSCHSASQLGKCAIKYGARAYVGFSDYMMFTTDAVKSENMYRDVLLPMATELINGKTVGEAVEITKTGLYEKARQWKSVEFIAIPFMWNYEYMQVLGDMNARLGG